MQHEKKMDRELLLAAGTGFDLHAEDARAAPMEESDSSDEAPAVDERPVINSSASMASHVMESSSSDDAEEGGSSGSLALAGLTLGAVEQDEDMCADDEGDFIDDEDDEDVHGYARDRRRQARDGSEAEEAEEDDIDMLKEMPEDWDVARARMPVDSAFRHYVVPRLTAIYRFVHHKGDAAPAYGGRFAMIFVQVPSPLGVDGEENICAIVQACRMTCKPRYFAIARAWDNSRAAVHAPRGKVTAADIERLVQNYTTRPASKQVTGGKDVDLKTYRELIKTTHKILEDLRVVHTMVTSVHANNKLTAYWHGYSKKYPIMNLLTAAFSAQSPSTLVATLKENRRQAPGHRADQYDELDHILEEMLEPTM